MLKNILYAFSFLFFCDSCSYSVFAKNGESEIAEILEEIKNVSDVDDVVTIHAAIAIQNYLANNASYKGDSLKGYDLKNPTIHRTKNSENKNYILVTFPTRGSNDAMAYAIMQQCGGGHLLNLTMGFMLYRKDFVESFVKTSSDSSSDFYRWDPCSEIVEFE